MTAAVIIPFLLVALTAPIALAKGGRPEQIGAVTISTWFVLDRIYHVISGPGTFDAVDPVHAFLDVSGFALFVWLAIKANRLWPTFVAGVLAIALCGHLVMALGFQGMQRAYWVMTQLPPLVMAIIVLLGTHTHVRRLRQVGPYRDWRRPSAP